MSRLFVECGWTQAKIAERVGRNQSWIARRLHFGRFLDYARGHKSESAPELLTERRFRQAWSAVGKGHPKETEAERFGRVAVRSETSNLEVFRWK